MKKAKVLFYLFLVLALVALAGCEARENRPTALPSDEWGTDPSDEWDDAPSDDISDEADSYDDIPEFYFSDGIDQNGFWEGIRALDYVEMFNYHAMSIPSEIHQISDDAVRREINDNILASYSTTEHVTNRAVAEGDTVNITYEGTVDGVGFDRGSTFGSGKDVAPGNMDFKDDILAGLIGHSPRETVDVKVAFPEKYPPNSTLEGKEAVFVTTINYILVKVPPDLTDDFVAANLSDGTGWTTVAQMWEDVRSDLKRDAITQYIDRYFTTEVTIRSIPDSLITYQEQAMVDYYQSIAARVSMGFGNYIASLGLSGLDELIQSNRDKNIENAAYSLVCQAVAEDAGFTVTDEDVANHLGTEDYSSVEEYYGLPYLKQGALNKMVQTYIYEHAILE